MHGANIPGIYAILLFTASDFTSITSHIHNQVVNTEIRLTMYFADKDEEALISQQKQDWELTVAWIMNLLPH